MKANQKLSPGVVTWALAIATLVVLVLSAPASLREALDRGEFYLFSRSFLEDIPKRLTGPGWFRLILQPLIAIILGVRSGMADARNGLPPYLYGLILRGDSRSALFKSGVRSLANLLLMAVLLDSLFQWSILGTSYPGAALLVGPVLIVTPYTLARALANRGSRLGKKE
jgi:hypothetical protein